MIYTVTLNPALDYIVEVPVLNMGEVNQMSASRVLAGGKGVNVSRVLKNLGHDNMALGFAAGFTGNQLIKDLTDHGCTADFISLERGFTRINLKIKGAETTEINGRGPEIPEIAVDALMMQLGRLKDGDILVLSGSVPDSVPEDIYERLMDSLKGKQVKVIVDARNHLLTRTLKYHPFLIKPNQHELGEIFQQSITDRQTAAVFGKKLQEMGAVNVLISMAGDGAVLLDEKGEIHSSPAPKGQVINPVGAGDSMVAGFLAGYLETGDYQRAFEMGLAAGSASAFSEELTTREGMETVLNRTFSRREESM